MSSRSLLLTFVALVALTTPALHAAAQTDPGSILQTHLPPTLDLAARTHDNWMVPSVPSLDLSPRTHDDWPLNP
jgi:hypothetical protein